jgi:hypothetical protein
METKIEVKLILEGPQNASVTQEQLVELNKELQKTAITFLNATNMIVTSSETNIINQSNTISKKPDIGTIVNFNGQLFQVVEVSLKDEKIKILQTESKEEKIISYLDAVIV